MRRKWLLAVIGVITAAVAGQLYYEGTALSRRTVWKHIEFGFETPGTTFDVIALRDDIEPAPTGIRVTRPWSAFQLTSLAQLRGLVRIANADQALTFVRLRTSKDYCYDWRQSILEIVSSDHAKEIDFKDRSALTHMARQDTVSGHYAVLSPHAFRSGGFSAPIVSQVPGGFRITRWVCLFNGLHGDHIQQWDEYVGHDGTYRMSVSKDMPAPKLPGTHWDIMGLM
jgi:hypothetical protein